MPSAAARSASAGTRHAPSRIEYSEWTWRWTKGASDTGRPSYYRVRTAPSEFSRQEHSALAGAVVVLDLGLDLEAEAAVEVDRARVPRGGDRVDGGAAGRPRG